MSPSHVRTNIITCLYIFNESNVFSWNFVLILDETIRLNIAFNQPTSCRTALHLAHLEPGNVRTGRTAFAMVPWLEEWVPWHWQKQTLLVSRNVSATSSKAGTVRNASHLELFHIVNTLCTALKPKCRTEILVAGKGMRQWKPQGQLRTISPWDTWYNSSYNTTPLKINSIKLLYSYVDSFHAVAASPYCTSVSTLYKLSYLLLVNYMVQSPHLSWR